MAHKATPTVQYKKALNPTYAKLHGDGRVRTSCTISSMIHVICTKSTASRLYMWTHLYLANMLPTFYSVL